MINVGFFSSGEEKNWEEFIPPGAEENFWQTNFRYILESF